MIRSDRGSDYTSKMYGELLLNKGINQEFCPPDGHGQVGKAEKRIADMCENAKTMLLASGHPYKYLFYAKKLYVGKANRLEKNGEPSPLEALGMSKELVKRQTFPFGSYFATTTSERWRKSEPGRVIHCTYLGEDWGSADSKYLLNIGTGLIIVRRSGKSIPGRFPLSLDPLEICTHFRKEDFEMNEITRTIEREKRERVERNRTLIEEIVDSDDEEVVDKYDDNLDDGGYQGDDSQREEEHHHDAPEEEENQHPPQEEEDDDQPPALGGEESDIEDDNNHEEEDDNMNDPDSDHEQYVRRDLNNDYHERESVICHFG